MATEISPAEVGEAEGCIQCQRGSKLVLFVTGKCHRDVITAPYQIIVGKLQICSLTNVDVMIGTRLLKRLEQ